MLLFKLFLLSLLFLSVVAQDYCFDDWGDWISCDEESDDDSSSSDYWDSMDNDGQDGSFLPSTTSTSNVSLCSSPSLNNMPPVIATPKSTSMTFMNGMYLSFNLASYVCGSTSKYPAVYVVNSGNTTFTPKTWFIAPHGIKNTVQVYTTVNGVKYNLARLSTPAQELQCYNQYSVQYNITSTPPSSDRGFYFAYLSTSSLMPASAWQIVGLYAIPGVNCGTPNNTNPGCQPTAPAHAFALGTVAIAGIPKLYIGGVTPKNSGSTLAATNFFTAYPNNTEGQPDAAAAPIAFNIAL